MRDLAALAGTSVNTISLALRDSPMVAPSTKKKIQAIATARGYRPNPLLSALAASKQRPPSRQTLAVFTKFDKLYIPGPGPGREFTTRLLAGMAERADELGFKLEEFPVHLPDSPDGARLTEILLARGIRGIVLFPSGDLAVDFPGVDWSRFAVVAANFHTPRLRVHRTATDNSRAMEICLEELQARGYQRIGLAFTRGLDPRLRYDCSGQYLAWRERQPPDQQVPIIPSDHFWPTNESVLAWLERYRPDAIIAHAANLPAAIAAYNARTGYDVGIAHLALPAEHECAGVDLRLVDVGRTAISILARELNLNHFGLPAFPEVCLVGGVWQEGPHIRPRSPV